MSSTTPPSPLGWAPNDAPEAGTAEDQARQAAIEAAGRAQGPAAEPIYDVENVPATMQVIPSYTPEGQPFVIPARCRGAGERAAAGRVRPN
jgi:hypothetical protein